MLAAETGGRARPGEPSGLDEGDRHVRLDRRPDRSTETPVARGAKRRSHSPRAGRRSHPQCRPRKGLAPWPLASALWRPPSARGSGSESSGAAAGWRRNDPVGEADGVPLALRRTRRCRLQPLRTSRCTRSLLHGPRDHRLQARSDVGRGPYAPSGRYALRTAHHPGERRRPAGVDGQEDRRFLARIGARVAPCCVVVAKGDDDLPPHNALRTCHSTPEVNGCAVPLHGGQRALRSGDCRGPRCGQDRGRCAWGARHSQGMFQ